MVTIQGSKGAKQLVVKTINKLPDQQGRKNYKVVRGNVALGTEVHTGDFKIESRGRSTFVTTSCVLSAPYSTVSTSITRYASIPLHPSSMNSYRLRQLASLYTSYKFHSFNIKWVPRVPTTTSGIIGGYYVDDPAEACSSFQTDGGSYPWGPALEGIIKESESGFLTPIWDPCVVSYGALFKEQNNFFRMNFSSGALEDCVQGAFILSAGSTLAAGTELGLFEISFTVELAHPISPVTSYLNSTGVKIPWSTGSAIGSYKAAFNTTDLGIYNYWKDNQGVYLVTSTNDYSSLTGNWEYPTVFGQSYVMLVNQDITTTSSYNTRFYFFASYAAFMAADIVSLLSGSIPTSDFTGFQVYKIGTLNPVNKVLTTAFPFQVRNDDVLRVGSSTGSGSQENQQFANQYKQSVTDQIDQRYFSVNR